MVFFQCMPLLIAAAMMLPQRPVGRPPTCSFVPLILVLFFGYHSIKFLVHFSFVVAVCVFVVNSPFGF